MRIRPFFGWAVIVTSPSESRIVTTSPGSSSSSRRMISRGRDRMSSENPSTRARGTRMWTCLSQSSLTSIEDACRPVGDLDRGVALLDHARLVRAALVGRVQDVLGVMSPLPQSARMSPSTTESMWDEPRDAGR